MKKKYVGLLASFGAACVPAMAFAAGPSLDDILTNSGIIEAGHLSASYTAGFNKGQTLAYRAFDTDSNSFEFNQAALTLSKLPTEGIGGLVTVTAGSDAQVINGSYGSGSSDFALTQGYLQWAKGPFTIIGGRFVTLAGAEVIDDSADANISRSLLFQMAEPLVHTGVRASYAINGSFTGYLGVSNSAVSGKGLDGDKTKTLETGLAFTSSDKKVSVGGYDYYGVDNIGGTNVKDNYFDLVATWQATDKLQLVGNGDYLRFVGSGAGGNFDGYAAGYAVYLNYTFNDSWKGSVRGEYLATKNDLTCPKSDGKCDIGEVTGTVGYTAIKGLTILGEVRWDTSGDRVYPNPGTDTTTFSDFSKDQGNVAIKAIYAFGNAPSS